MKQAKLEIFVGLFLVIGALAFGWLALQLGEIPWLTGSKTYILYAEFDNISGVDNGAEIRVAGVRVGTVRGLSLNEHGQARVTMQLDRTLQVPVDSMASVRSKGIIGDKYIQLLQGGDTTMLAPGETIVDTESAMDIESLISKFAFGKVEE